MADIGLTITEQRVLVSQAKARLMRELGIRQYVAHEFIRDLSMKRSVKMATIAQEILAMEKLT
jgi:AmiR/NasT family two-component response regulator